MKKIFVIGSLNMDLVIESPYIPTAGETLTGSGFMTNCGGKGANQSAACAKLGGNVYHCGIVGNDSFGDQLINNLNSFGVNTDFIRKSDSISSGIAVILVSEGDNRIIFDKGANGYLQLLDIEQALSIAEEGDIYLTQLENPIDVIGEGLRLAKSKGLFTILNPAPANADILPYLDAVDLITPNESELDLLGGKKALFERGITTILTTLGSKGFEISTPDTAKKFECPKVKAVDTTAAGDTLCGGLAAGLARGLSLDDSARLGSTAASIACTRRGAQQSIPTLDEVLSFKF